MHFMRVLRKKRKKKTSTINTKPIVALFSHKWFFCTYLLGFFSKFARIALLLQNSIGIMCSMALYVVRKLFLCNVLVYVVTARINTFPLLHLITLKSVQETLLISSNTAEIIMFILRKLKYTFKPNKTKINLYFLN